LKNAGGDSLKRMIALALVIVVFMFATTIATAASIPEIKPSNRTSGMENDVVPFGDPIGGGPPVYLATRLTEDHREHPYERKVKPYKFQRTQL